MYKFLEKQQIQETCKFQSTVTYDNCRINSVALSLKNLSVVIIECVIWKHIIIYQTELIFSVFMVVLCCLILSVLTTFDAYSRRVHEALFFLASFTPFFFFVFKIIFEFLYL